MPFTPKTWANDAAGGTPITADEANRWEKGIADGQPEAIAIQGTLTNAALITETVIASFALPANYLDAATTLNLRMLGQVSSTATLTYRIRIGAGLITDPIVATFVTSAAGVANAHTSADMLVRCLTAGASGTITGGGQAQLVSAVVGPATAAFATANVDTTQARTLVLTVQQSLSQTFTTRAATLEKIV